MSIQTQMQVQAQILACLSQLAEAKATIADLKERLEVLERKAKEQKTLGLNKNG